QLHRQVDQAGGWWQEAGSEGLRGLHLPHRHLGAGGLTTLRAPSGRPVARAVSGALRQWGRAIFAGLLLAMAAAVPAHEAPLGRWKTIDDATGKPKSVVEIYLARDGSIAGRVVDILDLKDGPNPPCKACKGPLRG